MARRLVNDNEPMFRVVVVRRQRRDNPQWQRGVISPDNPRFLWDGPEYTTAYGPFPKLGTARGQLTHHTVDVYGNPISGVVSGHIEQAHTVWTPVGEQAEPEQYRTDVYGTPCYRHADPDGDQFLAAAGAIPEQGPGIYFRTSKAGASIPLAHLAQFIARLNTIADVAEAEAAKEPTP